jgi:hypothetical protein
MKYLDLTWYEETSLKDYWVDVNLLKPKTYFMYRQLNIQKFYVLPTQLYLCVLCGSENKQRLFPYTESNIGGP